MQTFYFICKVKRIIFLIIITLGLIACESNNKVKHSEYIVSGDSSKVASEIKSLSEQIEKNPDVAENYFKRALNYQELGFLNRAEADFNEVLKLDSTNAYYFYMAGRLAFSKNETIKAAEYYNKSISIDSTEVEAQAKLAELYFVVKKHPESMELLNKLIQKDPHNGYYFQLRGLNLKEMGDTAAAIRSFQGAIERNEKDIDSYLFLARIYLNMKNPVALEYFNGALRIQTENKDALYGRAVFYQQSGHFEEAVKEYRRIISKDPFHIDSYYNVGLINFQLHHFDKALIQFEKCIQMNNEYLKAYYMKGLIQEIKGDKAKAKANYQFILLRNPKDAEALEGISRLGKK